MKLDAIIIHDKDKGIFTGFVKQFPGVCSQSDNKDTLVTNLDKYLKHWLKYSVANSAVSATDKTYSF